MDCGRKKVEVDKWRESEGGGLRLGSTGHDVTMRRHKVLMEKRRTNEVEKRASELEKRTG